LRSTCKECVRIDNKQRHKRYKQQNANIVLDPTKTKTCPKCKISKPLTKFNKNRTQSDSLNSYCKECVRIHDKQRYERYKQQNANIVLDPNKTKTCLTCKISKPLTKFNKNRTQSDSLNSYCKECVRIHDKQRYERYKQQNANIVLDPNKTKTCADCKVIKPLTEFTKNRARSDSLQSYCKKCANKKNYKYALKNPVRKLHYTISNQIRKYIKNGKGEYRTHELLGYTYVELKEHLESKFTEHMTWENHGTYWHIDHKVPKSWFPINSVDDIELIRECWALKNLQPLKASENILKSNKYAHT